MTDLAGLHVALLAPWASRLGGGVTTAVQAHAELIRSLGGRVTVVTANDTFLAEDRAAFGDVPVLAAPVIGPRLFGYSPRLGSLIDQANPDVLHLHGVWKYPSLAGASWAGRTGRPYIVSPHGMLDPWLTARGRWKKFLGRTLYERTSWRRAAVLHALTGDEAADIRAEAGAAAPVVVIPNPGPSADDAPGAARPPAITYLGRIHPKKNLAALVEGWREARLPDDAMLEIAGWGDRADVAELQRAIEGIPSIRFHGPAHGEAKRGLIRGARFMILPSLSEGLPMAILEAWAAGTPTLISTACHMPEGFSAGAALDCGTEAADIARALESALSLSEAQWRGMADAALALARGPFAASTVARQWAEVYRGLARPQRG